MGVQYVIVPLTVGIGLIVVTRIGVEWEPVLGAAHLIFGALVVQTKTDKRPYANAPDPKARDPPRGSKTHTPSRVSTINGFSREGFF